jgi:hypothetical protein
LIEGSLPKLVTLSLKNSFIRDFGLMNLLSAAKEIVDLNLWGCKQITGDDLYLLPEGALCKLTRLSLDYSTVSSRGVVAFLSRTQEIESLGLCNCKNLLEELTEDQIIFHHSFPHLTSINASDSLIPQILIEKILKKSQVVDLDLSNCPRLQSSFFSSLEPVSLSELKELGLNRAKIDDTNLLNILTYAKKLKSLDINGCNLDGSNFSFVETIELESLKLGGQSDLFFEKILPKATKLTSLQIWSNVPTAHFIKHLTEESLANLKDVLIYGLIQPDVLSMLSKTKIEKLQLWNCERIWNFEEFPQSLKDLEIKESKPYGEVCRFINKLSNRFPGLSIKHY